MYFEKNVGRYCVSEQMSVSAFLKHFVKDKPRFYCVVNNQHELVGVISLGDIARATAKSISGENSISTLMNKEFHAINDGASLSTLKHNLEEYRFVPVVDELGRLKMLVQGLAGQREFYIGNHSIQRSGDYLLVAEIGNNHNGCIEKAFELIRSAKNSGAHIAKFQMRDMSTLYGDTSVSHDLSTEYVINLLQKVSLSDEDMIRCFDFCKEVGITPLCTPFDLNSLQTLENYGMEGYKVASADLTNHELLEALVKTNKPLIVSTGMSTDGEIDEAISLLERHYVNYVICHANSTYPAPFSDVHLNYIDNLKSRTSSVIGYSGHERGWHIPLGAFTKGAQVIEKHFTLDKTLEGNDHKVSLLPSEFLMLSQALADLSEAMGIGYKRQITQGEATNKIALSKSIFCAKPVGRGELIKDENIVIRSPGNGLSPRMKRALVGKISSRDIDIGEAFFQTDLDGHKEIKSLTLPKHFKWCIPVRHRDVYKLYNVFKPPAIEFHLSFKDLKINDKDTLIDPLNTEVIIHSPEQFDDDFILDLFSEDVTTTQKTISLLDEIFRKARNISQLLGYKGYPKVVVNCGGHTHDAFLSQYEAERRVDNFIKNIQKVDLSDCRFLAQTMPPYPWHFGGQSFHNQFTSSDNILSILSKSQQPLELCLDISHSYMWCNYSNENFEKFIEKIAPHVSHIHISDAAGESEEGMQVGEGTLDFGMIRKAFNALPADVTLLPEIWQGHDNLGDGFRIALERLNKFGY